MVRGALPMLEHCRGVVVKGLLMLVQEGFQWNVGRGLRDDLVMKVAMVKHFYKVLVKI